MNEAALEEAERFKEFVLQYIPDSARAVIRYEYEILDCGEALYPNYTLEAIEVERRDGTTVRLDQLIDERAENEAGFIKGLTEDWGLAIATEDDTIMHDLLKPLVLASHDPYLKAGKLEFDFTEAA